MAEGENSEIYRFAKGQGDVKIVDWPWGGGGGNQEIFQSPARNKNAKFDDQLMEKHLKIHLSIIEKNYKNFQLGVGKTL